MTSLRIKLLLFWTALALLLLSACAPRISERELSVFVEKALSLEGSIVTAFRSTDELLAEFTQTGIGGDTTKEQIRQMREDVRSKRNELLLLPVPDALHQLKLLFLDAADKAGLALQYAAVFAETGDEAMSASWETARDLTDLRLRTAISRLNALRSG